MPAVLVQLTGLLVTPPGNLVYSFVLSLSLALSLALVLSNRQSVQPLVRKRLLTGLAAVFMLRLALILVSLLSGAGWLDEHSSLPVLEREIGGLSLVILLWLWVFMQPSRLGDLFSLLALLGTLAVSAVGFVLWSTHNAGISFNSSLPDFLFTFTNLALLLVAFLILLLHRPSGWGLGLVFLLLLLAGNGLHLLVPVGDVDYPGMIRLAELAAYPVLLGLPQILNYPLTQPGKTEPEGEAETAAESEKIAGHEIRRTSLDPELIQAWIAFPVEVYGGNLAAVIPSLATQTMLADLCVLVSVQAREEQVTLHGGYDLIRERRIDGLVYDGRQTPQLVEAVRAGHPLRLDAEKDSEELNHLAVLLNQAQAGYLLCVPIFGAGNKPLFGLVLLSPYSNRAWNGEDQELLTNLAFTCSKLLQQYKALSDLQAELGKMQISQAAAMEEASLVRQALHDLTERQPAEESRHDEHIEPDPAAQAELRLALEEIARLRTGSGEKLEAVAGEIDRISPDSEFDQEDRYPIGHSGQEGTGLLETPEAGGETPVSREYQRLAQELRQPLASIIGYTDFLLGESLGILGTLQHKFLERIRLATDRMSGLLDELNQTDVPVIGVFQLSPRVVNLNAIFDHAMQQTRVELQEKDISLRVDMPEVLPDLLVDSGAMEQILISLIENAGRVTPAQGQITLRVDVRSEPDEQGFVLIQVGDQGGGIDSKDLPHVFSRLSGEPFQGMGDSGAGLSIIKTLVESQNGRIWVDSQPGSGAVFSVLFPVYSIMDPEPTEIKKID